MAEDESKYVSAGSGRSDKTMGRKGAELGFALQVSRAAAIDLNSHFGTMRIAR